MECVQSLWSSFLSFMAFRDVCHFEEVSILQNHNMFTYLQSAGSKICTNMRFLIDDQSKGCSSKCWLGIFSFIEHPTKLLLKYVSKKPRDIDIDGFFPKALILCFFLVHLTYTKSFWIPQLQWSPCSQRSIRRILEGKELDLKKTSCSKENLPETNIPPENRPP